MSANKIPEALLEAFCLEKAIALLSTVPQYRQAICAQSYSHLLSSVIARRTWDLVRGELTRPVEMSVQSDGSDLVLHDGDFVEALVRRKMDQVVVQVLREKSKYILDVLSFFQGSHIAHVDGWRGRAP